MYDGGKQGFPFAQVLRISPVDRDGSFHEMTKMHEMW